MTPPATPWATCCATTGGTQYANQCATSLARYDGYKEASTSAVSSRMLPGSSAQQYDANGYLVGVTDATRAGNNRTLINNASGLALYVNQAGHARRQ